MAKLLTLLLVGLLFEAIGVVLLNKGIKEMGDVPHVNAAEIIRVVRTGATNPNILLGVFFEAIFFGCLLILMSKGDVSFIWPLTSLGFVLTTVAARFYLREQVSALRWLGVLLIMLGAGLITWTEKNKPAPPQAAPAANAVLPPR